MSVCIRPGVQTAEHIAIKLKYRSVAEILKSSSEEGLSVVCWADTGVKLIHISGFYIHGTKTGCLDCRRQWKWKGVV